MSILVDKNTRLLVQGITGNEGTFHSRAMLAYGTNIVAGVTPGRGGQMAVDGKVPVFNTVKEAVAATGANASIIYVPAPLNATDSIIEAAEAGIALIVCISEGVPANDMVAAYEVVRQHGARLIDARRAIHIVRHILCPFVRHVQIIRQRIELRQPLTATHPVDQAATRHHRHPPWLGGARGVEARGRAPDVDEDILHCVFRFLRIGRPPTDE